MTGLTAPSTSTSTSTSDSALYSRAAQAIFQAGALVIWLLATQTTTATELTQEELRTPKACQEISGLACNSDEQIHLTTIAGAKRLGHKLWRRAQQPNANAVIDDRPLYWQRLSVKRKTKLIAGDLPNNKALLEAFERASRGFNDILFNTGADLNILITGFDPFGLHNHIDQTNPSGVAALAFDGLVIRAEGITAELQSAMFPVRFKDFDNGIVESVMQPLLSSSATPSTKLDAIITISMGRDGFDLERFPARRRSAKAPDNLMVTTGASRTNPLLPSLNNALLAGPEFVEFTLPIAGMLSVQTPYPARDNKNVATLMRGQFTVSSLQDLKGETSVSGSGGGYLSNEISYRTLLLVHNAKSPDRPPVPSGHIHTPRLSGYEANAVRNISGQIRAMLEAALPELSEASRARRLH